MSTTTTTALMVGGIGVGASETSAGFAYLGIYKGGASTRTAPRRCYVGTGVAHDFSGMIAEPGL